MRFSHFSTFCTIFPGFLEKITNSGIVPDVLSFFKHFQIEWEPCRILLSVHYFLTGKVPKRCASFLSLFLPTVPLVLFESISINRTVNSKIKGSCRET